MTLREPLIFCERDKASGKEIHRHFPAGTPVQPIGDLNDDETRICKLRCKALERDLGGKYETLILGGRPRILNRRYVEGK
jgi:hypothetical protein